MKQQIKKNFKIQNYFPFQLIKKLKTCVFNVNINDSIFQ
jgi:hypothetical protein